MMVGAAAGAVMVADVGMDTSTDAGTGMGVAMVVGVAAVVADGDQGKLDSANGVGCHMRVASSDQARLLVIPKG